MGLFDKIFPQKAQERQVQNYFKTFNAYSPVFQTYNQGIYEMELTRSCIHSFANLASKLKPEISRDIYKNLEKTLQFKPNPYMSASTFIYKIATILAVDTTCFIIPLYAEDYRTIVGYYPIKPSRAELVEVEGSNELFLRYTFENGQKAAIEFDRVGVLTEYSYENDFFGDGHGALNPTLQLIDVQRQGMEDSVKQSATIRFMGQLGQTLRSEDIAKERKRFSQENLSSDNTSGLMLFDTKYANVQQVNSQPQIIDAEQMKLIQTNVYNYFGTNEDILQNKFSEEVFNAYYESKIESFALQLSLELTNMTFNAKEREQGSQILFTSNRMAFASNKTKLQVSTQLFDRGILTTNDIKEIWNLPPIEGGDKLFIRREYVELNRLDKDKNTEDIGNIHEIDTEIEGERGEEDAKSEK